MNPFADAFPDQARPAPPPDLPARYEDPAALDRIRRGLLAAGHPDDTARFAAGIALTEAPFAPPDPDGWRRACARARQVATEGLEATPERPPPEPTIYRPQARPRPRH